jgi:hypothetical protein
MTNRDVNWQIGLILSFFLISYSVYFGFERETALRFATEDHLFETGTALLFVITSIFFGRCYLDTKNVYFLLLTFAFVFAAGEEISWGQRFIGFKTPEIIQQRNQQNEFNFHNLDIFHPQDEAGVSKSGFSKLLTLDFLYNLFWFSWCIVLPIAIHYVDFIRKITSKMKLPVPLLSLGIFFMINFCIFYVLRKFFISGDKSDLFYMKLREVYECSSAFIFFLIAWSFYLNNVRPETGHIKS